MIIKYKYIAALVIALTALVAGCSNKPPGCADPDTLTTVKQLVEDNANKYLSNRDAFNDDPDGWMKKFYDELKVELSSVVSEGYKEDAKKQLCRGTLKVTTGSGQTLERAVEYSTQKTEDKKDSFLLEFQDFTAFGAGTAQEERKYYDGKRWAGTWNGIYACSGVNGATEGPQGPYSMPVSMVVEGTAAKLERTTKGGGVETLEGKFDSMSAAEPYKLRGDGQNSPDDRWTTGFAGKVTGKRFVADGAITVRGEILRKCHLDLALGGPLASQSISITPQAAQAKAGFSGRYASHGESDVTADIGQPNAAGAYQVKVTTTGQASGGGSCGGAVEGVAAATSTALKMDVVSEGQACSVLLSINPDGTLKIAEDQGCMYFHGAACGFSDTLTRIR
jgi:hypothetical protein